MLKCRLTIFPSILSLREKKTESAGYFMTFHCRYRAGLKANLSHVSVNPLQYVDLFIVSSHAALNCVWTRVSLALAVHGEMVWNCQAAGPVWEGPLHRDQFHSDDGQLYSSGQLGNTVSHCEREPCGNVSGGACWHRLALRKNSVYVCVSEKERWGKSWGPEW